MDKDLLGFEVPRRVCTCVANVPETADLSWVRTRCNIQVGDIYAINSDANIVPTVDVGTQIA